MAVYQAQPPYVLVSQRADQNNEAGLSLTGTENNEAMSSNEAKYRLIDRNNFSRQQTQ